VGVQRLPHLPVGARRVPADGVGVAKRDPLPFGEKRRLLEGAEAGQLLLVRDL
jgi:hypothetical protein